jgi:hypothetical protein
MSFYRHNNTGKYFIVLQSQLEKIPTEPNKGDDIVLPYRKEVSEVVGINSEISNDFFRISRNYYETDKGGADKPLTTVPDFQETLLKTIASEEAKTSLETTSNSNMLGFKIKKGKLSLNPSDPQWPKLLNELSTDPKNSLLNKSVSKLLADNNLNNPDNPFFNPQNFNENKVVLGTIQYKNLGEHGPRKFPNVVQSSAAADQITIDEMKKVGLNLLVAASGVDLTMQNASFDDPRVPSTVDDGYPIKFGSMKPTTVLTTIKPEYRNADNNDSVFDNSNLVDSYGSPNNPSKPYTGTQKQISSPVLFTKILALSVAFKSIIQKFNITGRNLGDHLENGSSRDRQKLLGSYTANAGDEAQGAALDPFELPPISNDFYLSVQAGFKQFFGLDDNYETQASGRHAGQTSKTYGYISTFVRKLNAAVNTLNATISSVNVNTTALDQTNPADQQLERLRSNFAIRFIRIMAIIGDKFLILRSAQQQVPVQGIEGFVSDIDGTPERVSPRDSRLNPGILVVKHRLDTRNGAIAYGTSTLPSLLLFPQGISDANASLAGESTADMNFTSVDTALNTLMTTNTVVTDAKNDRIDAGFVKKIEDFLEMDYMPFYFHDLRTNEIISFHAFLESATDSLNADYNETEGYGRTGVIPVYKNTKRTINFTFKVLATNRDDHDQMWYKINRLAACLYPQYSEGRLLTNGGNKFIQPFSQVFAASPLMRIRFGDLWKSNYSKLAIARIFGLAGQNDGDRSTFQLTETRTVVERPAQRRTRSQEEIMNMQIEAGLALVSREFRIGDKVNIIATANKHRWPVSSRDNNLMGNPSELARAQARGQRIGQYSLAQNLFLYIPSGHVEGEIVEIHPSTRRTGNNYLVRVTNARTGNSGQLNGFIISGGNTRPRSVNGQNQFGENPTNYIVCVNPMHMSYVIPTIEPVEEIPEITRTERINSSIPDFFKCDGDNPNPIMKAFCSTEGKGLACVIRQMSLENIIDVPWAVERFDGRAPQLLTVNMEITPIHDVNPGLDNKGFMTAPIWPTGTIVNNVMGNGVSSPQGQEKFIQSRTSYLFPHVNRIRD